MAEMNKVEVTFDADVTRFNRGVDSMERKLERFDAKASRETEKVGKRFDLLDGELKKVEKTMGGFGKNMDLKNVQNQLDKTKQEFEETGKVGQKSLIDLDKAVNKVNFDKLSTKSKKAFTMLQKDMSKLHIETGKLNDIKYADSFQNENKLIANSFIKLNKAMDHTMLSFDNASKHMNSKELDNYVKSTNNARHSLFKMKSELEKTGTISRDTFYKVNEDIKKVNFNNLPLSAQRAVKGVSREFGTLTRTFDNMGTHITKNQNRLRNLDRVGGNSMRTLKLRSSETMAVFGRWATVFRNISEVGETVFAGVLRPVIAGLIPVAGTATTSIMAIGSSLSTVIGGAIGLGGAFGISLVAVKMFTSQASTALQMLEDGQLRVTNEVKNYQSALQGLKNDWKSLISQNQAQIFNTMTNGIKTAQFSLNTLNPFLVKTAKHIEVASAKMHKWVTSSENAQRAFKMLNNIGPSIFKNILNSAGHMGNGITRIFTAFGPLFTWTGQGLEKLSKKFDIWANSSNTQRGIASFINYTKENLPILGSVFGNTFLGIINLFKAFSGQTQWALKGLDSLTERFKNWADTLDQTEGFKGFIKFTRDNAPLAGEFIGNLTNVIVQLTKAIAPISVQVLKVMNAFLGWLGPAMDSSPVFARLIGLLVVFSGLMKGGLFVQAMIRTFFGLDKIIKILIGTQKLQILTQRIFNTEQIKSKGLLAIMAGWYTKLITRIKAFSFAQMMAGIKTKGMNTYIAIQNGLLRIKNALWLTARKRLMAFILAQTLNIKTLKMSIVATKAWAVASKVAALATRGLGLAIRFMTGPVGIVITIIGLLVGAVIHLWKTNATFRNGVIAIWNSIKQAAINVFGWLKPYLNAIWNGIKNGAIWTWNAIKNVASAIWRGIAYAIKNPIGALKATLSAIWNGIKYVSIATWNAIRNVTLAIVRALVNGVKATFNGLKSFFSFLWNGIKAISIGAWNGIKNLTLAIIRAYISGVKKIFNTLKSFFVSLWNSVKTITINAWRIIKNSVLIAVRALSLGVRKIFGTLKNWIVSTWTFIKNKLISLARSISTGVRNAFTGLYNGIRKIITNLRNWLVKAWTYIRSKIIALARSLSSHVRSAFSGLYNGVRNIMTRLRNWLVSIWNYIRNKISALARSLWNNVRNTWNNLWNGTRNIFGKVRSFITDVWRKIKNSVVGTVNGLWSSVRRTFNNMNSGLANIIRKIKGHINGMVTSVKKGLNNLIKGVNWVGDKLGMGKQMIKPLKLSTGTSNARRYVSNGKINRDTMAVVGDKGRGNGKGGYRNETITYPNGNKVITPGTDTLAYLPKGSTVESGAQTQANGIPQFSNGTLPRFNAGTWLTKKGGELLDGIGDKANSVKHKTADTISKGYKGAKELGGKAVGIAKDLFEYASNPGKLVDLVLKKFGVNFDFVKGDMLSGIMKGAFKKLKGGVKELFKGWLEESGGADLSSFDKFTKTTPYSPNKAVPGYGFNGGRHYGIDYATPVGHVIKAPTNGVVSKMHDNGGGNVAKLLSGKFTQFFLHLSKVLKTGRVKQGEKFAVTGNSGAWTTGPHLHYQVEKGNSPYITNRNTIDPEKFASMGGGGGNFGKGSAAARKIIKRAQAIMGGRFNSNYVTEQMMRLAKRESNFDPNAVNNWDINARNGNPSRGMFQIIKTTFDGSKTKGRNNYKNPVDQAVAVLNYINKRYSPHYGFNGAFKRAADRAYATGGIANFPQIAWLAEGGFSESIISHDPANKVKSKAIHDRTGEMLGFNEDVVVMNKVADLLEENNKYQAEIAQSTERTANKSSVIQMNGRAVAHEIASDVNNEIKKQEDRKVKLRGGGR